MEASSSVTEIDSVQQGVRDYLLRKHSNVFLSVSGASILFLVIAGAMFYLQGRQFLPLIANDDSFAILIGIFLLFILLIPQIIMYWVAYKQVRREFMQQIAESLGYTYSTSAPLESVSGVLFSDGHAQKIYDVISGTYKNFPVRLFTYQYTTGYGKSAHTFYTTCLELTYEASLPHILLYPGYIFAMGLMLDLDVFEKVSLEGNFDDYFSLYVSKNAQVETREILTPDIMQELIQSFTNYKMEINGNKVYMSIQKILNTRSEILEMHDLADSLIDGLLPGFRATSVRN